MSTQKKKKISSTLLKADDHKAIEQLMKYTGSIESVVLRGLIRVGICQYKKAKISVLELIKIGAY